MWREGGGVDSIQQSERVRETQESGGKMRRKERRGEYSIEQCEGQKRREK